MRKIVLILSLLVAQNIMAQRGIYPIEVEVEGKLTTLYKESHALIIGNSNYTAGWGSLAGVKGDVVKVKEALTQNGFNVTVKENLNSVQMSTEIANFLSTYGYKPNNRVLIYYAGHGHTLTNNNTQMGYIVPVDAPNPNNDIQGFIRKALPMSNFKTWSESTTFSKHALFVFDACFAGSIFTSRSNEVASEVINYNTLNPVRQFIASGSAKEKVPDQSVFCSQFVYALQSNAADYNKDNYLTATELGEYLKNTVIEYRKTQHPQYGKLDNPDFDKGDFVFLISKPNEEATVVILSDFTGELFIDNEFEKDIIAGKKYTETIAAGKHTIEVKLGDKNWKQTVTLSKNQELKLFPEATNDNIFDNDRGSTTKTDDLPDRITDIEGNSYKIVKIGTQVWMAENLRTTKYNDGSNIPHVTEKDEWTKLTKGAYCWYDNDQSNKTKYGALYNYYTVETNKLCPTGWHVPSDEEWTELENYLIKNGYNWDGTTEGDKTAKSLAAKSGWKSSEDKGDIGNDMSSNNKTGFTALPGGYRLADNGSFNFEGSYGYWWSSTPYGSENAYSRSLSYSSGYLIRHSDSRRVGFSVRCVQGN